MKKARNKTVDGRKFKLAKKYESVSDNSGICTFIIDGKEFKVESVGRKIKSNTIYGYKRVTDLFYKGVKFPDNDSAVIRHLIKIGEL